MFKFLDINTSAGSQGTKFIGKKLNMIEIDRGPKEEHSLNCTARVLTTS